MRFFCNSAFLLFTLLPAGPLLVAQTTPPKTPTPAPAIAPDPKKLPYIEEIFRLTKPETMVNNALAQSKAAFQQAASQGFEQEVRKFDDPSKYRADYVKVQDRVFAMLSTRLNWQKLKPQYMQVYSDTFTAEELAGMANFYKSPAGRAFLDRMPQVMQKWSEISQRQMGNMGPEVQKMMNDLFADVKRRSAASSPKPPAK